MKYFSVPSKSDQKYVSFSVRIHTEYCKSQEPLSQRPKRILIVLWPFFTVRSLLPMHLTLGDVELNKNYAIQGKGGCIDLQIAGTFDTEHEFSFNLGLDNERLSKTILTYKSIDKKSFFAIPSHFKCIDDIIKELEKSDELKWPCSKEAEVSMFSSETFCFLSFSFLLGSLLEIMSFYQISLFFLVSS